MDGVDDVGVEQGSELLVDHECDVQPRRSQAGRGVEGLHSLRLRRHVRVPVGRQYDGRRLRDVLRLVLRRLATVCRSHWRCRRTRRSRRRQLQRHFPGKGSRALFQFLPRDAMHERGLCLWLGVCLSH